jgi:hypothetical protein
MFIVGFVRFVVDHMSRFGAKIVLRLNWSAVSDDEARFIGGFPAPETFPRIEVEARMACFRDMVARMKFHHITFGELGINPLAFWEKLKELGLKVRREIDRYFRANYYGKRMIDSYMRITGEVFGLVHDEAVAGKVIIPS